MLSHVPPDLAWDTKRVGILKMTFVPRPPGDHSDRPDGFCLTLRICVSPLILVPPETNEKFEWVDIARLKGDVANTSRNDDSDGIPISLLQLPFNTDLLPIYRL
ncbi:unnamed protein product [Echinostoma caproni]|uniref:Nudix hydrolase domain-containing protein n=1 Tax=Echinostoma caproni TaxID=27848 RepID=A0A183AQR9_9TREM|nr:unnamed protein product [Echinostoma caproni]